MIQYDGMRQPYMQIPILPEKEGFVIDYDIESGWPYYVSVEDFEMKKKMHVEFMARISKLIQGEPRKGTIQIISTPADVNSSDKDFHKLWTELKIKL